MLYVDDLIVADKEDAGIQTRFTDWYRALESKGLKININKTETVVCTKTNKTLKVRDRTGNLLKEMETLKYLGSVMSAKGGCEYNDKNRIKAA